jgi:hypothetical protein
MKHGDKMLIGTLAALTLCVATNAATSDSSVSPYQGVVERNVFGLKPPPPPPDPEATKPPPPKIFLQGITTFGGIKRALLKAQMPAKPGEPPKPDQSSFILAEGQRDGDIEVLEIDAKEGTVKVNDFGTITTLDFEHNGIKTPTAAPGPGAAPQPGGGLALPGAKPFGPAGGGGQPIPTIRPMRLPLPGGAAASPASGGATPVYASGTPASGGGTPSLALGGTSAPLYGSTPAQAQPQPQAAVPPTSQLSAEEQFLIIEANREQQKQLGQDKKLPPLPPTPLTPGTPESGPTTPTRPNLPPRPGQPLLPPTS